MRVVIGSDHRGIALRAKVASYLKKRELDMHDYGAFQETSSVDYPDIAAMVAREVSNGSADRGILICGTGIGMSITANKFPGVRAAVCLDELTAEISRRHNNLNVLCLSGDMLGEQAVEGILNIWLDTPFDGGRHERRIEKIAAIENANNCKSK